MDTRWKNKIAIAVWTFLFTFGLSGMLTLLINGGNFVNRDYFQTGEFQSELYQFAAYLSIFELNEEFTPVEAKKAITVSEEEIDEHRYRYGTLPAQVDNIKSQYEERIQGAEAAGDEEAKAAFISERDTKIADITKNFESNDYVRPKVKVEKEQKIDQYFKEMEKQRDEFLRYKKSFTYYFKNTETGEVYTNLNLSDSESPEEYMNSKNRLFLTDYFISPDYINYFGFPGDEAINEAFISANTSSFEGQIALAENLPASNYFMSQYNDYKQKQLFLLVYAAASIAALIISLIAAKRSKAIPAEVERWRPLYNWLPIDLRIIFFILIAIGAVLSLFLVSSQFMYLWEVPYDRLEIPIFLIGASVLCGLALVQWKYLVAEFRDWKNVKKHWEKALLHKAGDRIHLLLSKAKNSIREAFLNQSTGTQLFVVLAAIFGLGLASIMIFVHPIFVLFYLLLLGAAGFPLVIALVNRIGYFNRIVETTNELAAGNLGQDLQVTGKTVLAALAGNINILKQGVKTSLKEQAKSERLKTELITNVSHDLRTPLTSIITYTELLKSGEVSSEDRSAYLEIIDRKSKRLKVLIDDLFEVSKMASGNIELRKDKVDLVQLLQQALAEHDDAINDSSLHFRVANPGVPVYANVDGQKLWRVFDNLIGNILKYSLENSRVYIAVAAANGQAAITFKNVSKYELNDESEELFERFKRGDESRNTDGSGLGLAIAKSIIDLHDGRLDIDTDGDLFKVTISLKLAE